MVGFLASGKVIPLCPWPTHDVVEVGELDCKSNVGDLVHDKCLRAWLDAGSGGTAKISELGRMECADV